MWLLLEKQRREAHSVDVRHEQMAQGSGVVIQVRQEASEGRFVQKDAQFDDFVAGFVADHLLGCRGAGRARPTETISIWKKNRIVIGSIDRLPLSVQPFEVGFVGRHGPVGDAGVVLAEGRNRLGQPDDVRHRARHVACDERRRRQQPLEARRQRQHLHRPVAVAHEAPLYQRNNPPPPKKKQKQTNKKQAKQHHQKGLSGPQPVMRSTFIIFIYVLPLLLLCGSIHCQSTP